MFSGVASQEAARITIIRKTKYTHICVKTCACVPTRICMCVCVYLYIYIYTYSQCSFFSGNFLRKAQTRNNCPPLATEPPPHGTNQGGRMS